MNPADRIRELGELVEVLREKQARTSNPADAAAVAQHIVTLQAEQRRLIALVVTQSPA